MSISEDTGIQYRPPLLHCFDGRLTLILSSTFSSCCSGTALSRHILLSFLFFQITFFYSSFSF